MRRRVRGLAMLYTCNSRAPPIAAARPPASILSAMRAFTERRSRNPRFPSESRYAR